jgi:glutamate-1-semialdehyde 2,1-aminomutase
LRCASREPSPQRPKILVFNGCYHGTVDETFVSLRGGKPCHRAGLLGQHADLTADTRVVEFNDVDALDRELAHGDVACVIAEPVMTNSCMVLPAHGFHDALRDATRRHGTLLLIDETHTISTGPGGYTRQHGLEPDLFVLGKPIAGGVPASVWGFTDAVADDLTRVRAHTEPGHSGIGTTLSANALQLAALRATLEHVMTDAAYAHMEDLAQRLATELDRVIDAHELPWHVVRVGARVEFVCAPGPLRNGSEAESRLRTGARAGHPPRLAQPRLPDRAVPQHDASLSRNDGESGRPAWPGIRCGRRSARGLTERAARLEPTHSTWTRRHAGRR